MYMSTVNAVSARFLHAFHVYLAVVSQVCNSLFHNFISSWKGCISSTTGTSSEGGGRGGNKLRICNTFRYDYCPELYVCNHFPHAHRRALALFGCGVARLKV